MEVHCSVILWVMVQLHAVNCIIPYPGDTAAPEDVIRYYYTNGYTMDEIVGFLFFGYGIMMSKSTFYRILKKLKLRRRGNESPLAQVLPRIVYLLKHGYMNFGYRSIWKILHCVYNLRVTQATVRECLKTIDPIGVMLRQRRRLRRRTYINPGPNYTIHIDGYDKLKPYGISIHGAIDGYSRKILWLEANHSNKCPKLIARFFCQFLERLQRHPREIRADNGTENVLVKDIQETLTRFSVGINTRRSGFSAGRSTANQRIEMLWSFLKQPFTQFWRNHFKDLIEQHLLDNTNATHVEYIRFCFLPVIQCHLNSFSTYWNSHRIRQQSNSEVPCGIPDVLYAQPQLYGGEDFSIELPCRPAVLAAISERFTRAMPAYGCKRHTIRRLQRILGEPIEEVPIPQNCEDATRLYKFLVEESE